MMRGLTVLVVWAIGFFILASTAAQFFTSVFFLFVPMDKTDYLQYLLPQLLPTLFYLVCGVVLMLQAKRIASWLGPFHETEATAPLEISPNTVFTAAFLIMGVYFTVTGFATATASLELLWSWVKEASRNHNAIFNGDDYMAHQLWVSLVKFGCGLGLVAYARRRASRPVSGPDDNL